MNSTVTERITTRDATAADVPFLAWVMLEASRSHLPRGLWEHMNDQTGEEALGFLADLAVTDTVHLCHHSLFRIAEVDGEPAAAACAYDGGTEGFPVYLGLLPELLPRFGLAHDDPGYLERVAAIESGFGPWPTERPWVIENVATRPKHRGKGLVRLVLGELLERGAARGFSEAQIGVLIGNEPARRAYLGVGFEVVSEQRDPRWEAAMGCPGTELLLRRYP